MVRWPFVGRSVSNLTDSNLNFRHRLMRNTAKLHSSRQDAKTLRTATNRLYPFLNPLDSRKGNDVLRPLAENKMLFFASFAALREA